MLVCIDRIFWFCLGDTYALQFEGRLDGVPTLELLQQAGVCRRNGRIPDVAVHDTATPASGAAASASLRLGLLRLHLGEALVQ